MTVQELHDQLATMLYMGHGGLPVVVEGLPTEESGYLVQIRPVRGATLQNTPKGTQIVVR